jgi:excinuclease UvrABC helicase subunit UvrB
MLNLSPDQQVALDDIDNLFNSEYREQVLTGGPGMGKSFLTGKVRLYRRRSSYSP